MTLQIEQGFEYQGHDYWKWWAWLEGAEEELDQVERVAYHLHRTFPNPLRTVTDRASKFRLDAAGWGGFTLRATVYDKNGTRQTLSREVELRYPDGTPTTA
jgi:transcription initiation factor IIF auxiliary subunit